MKNISTSNLEKPNTIPNKTFGLKSSATAVELQPLVQHCQITKANVCPTYKDSNLRWNLLVVPL